MPFALFWKDFPQKQYSVHETQFILISTESFYYKFAFRIFVKCWKEASEQLICKKGT